MRNTFKVATFHNDYVHHDSQSWHYGVGVSHRYDPDHDMHQKKVCAFPGLVPAGEFDTLSQIQDTLRAVLSELNLTVVKRTDTYLELLHYTHKDSKSHDDGIEICFNFPNRLKTEMFMRELEKVNKDQISYTK